MDIERSRCFVQWFVLFLAYISIGAIAARYGLPQLIWKTDTTYMTSVIAAIFLATVLYVGFASWRYDRLWGKYKSTLAAPIANADIGLATKAAYIVTLFGLLGTVIGLQRAPAPSTPWRPISRARRRWWPRRWPATICWRSSCTRPTPLARHWQPRTRPTSSWFRI
jgi:hypothetical protein